jgi:hypothetical protein
MILGVWRTIYVTSRKVTKSLLASSLYVLNGFSALRRS